MDAVLTAVKADLNNVLNAGRYILASFFVLAVFFNYIGLLSRGVNWAEVILRLVIGLVLLQNYTWMMDTTRDIVVSVDEMINPNHDFVTQYSIMSDNVQKRHTESIQRGIIAKVVNAFGWPTLHTLVMNLSFIFYGIIARVMEAVRYSLVGVLYKLGPVLIPFILFQSTGQVIKGWFSSYVSVLCWPILWHIILGIAVTLSGNNPSLEQFACINFAVCFVLILSPLIVNSLVAGIGTGSVGSLAGALSTRSVVDSMTKIGQAGLVVAGAKVVQPLVDKVLGNKSPTTTAGKFKDVMLGDQGKGAKS